MAKPGWFSLKVEDDEVKTKAQKLQSADTELYTVLALHGSESIRKIEDRMRDAFPGREEFIELEWDAGMDGLKIRLSSASQGLLDSIRDEVVDIVNDEMTDMSVKFQRDFARRIM